MSYSAVLTMAYVKFIAYFTGRYPTIKGFLWWGGNFVNT